MYLASMDREQLEKFKAFLTEKGRIEQADYIQLILNDTEREEDGLSKRKAGPRLHRGAKSLRNFRGNKINIRSFDSGKRIPLH